MSFVGYQDVINRNVDYELRALAKDASGELDAVGARARARPAHAGDRLHAGRRARRAARRRPAARDRRSRARAVPTLGAEEARPAARAHAARPAAGQVSREQRRDRPAAVDAAGRHGRAPRSPTGRGARAAALGRRARDADARPSPFRCCRCATSSLGALVGGPRPARRRAALAGDASRGSPAEVVAAGHATARRSSARAAPPARCRRSIARALRRLRGEPGDARRRSSTSATAKCSAWSRIAASLPVARRGRARARRGVRRVARARSSST